MHRRIFRIRFVALPIIALSMTQRSATAINSNLGQLPATQPSDSENASPSTQPSAEGRPAIGSIDIGDYCTVLLAPKLQDLLAATDSQRATFSDLKTQLKSYIDNAAGNVAGPNVPPGILAARGQHVLAMIGAKVKPVLTAAQDQQLVALFEDQTLRPIEVGASSAHLGNTLYTNIKLIYTHYGESPANIAQLSGEPGATTQPLSTTRPDFTAIRARARQIERDSLGVTSIAQAEQLLGTDVISDQVRAAKWLANEPIAAGEQSKVIGLLKHHLNDRDPMVRLPFVQAFAQWASIGEIADLSAVLDRPAQISRGDGQPIGQHEQCWASAVIGLLRLDPTAATQATDKRISSFFFRAALQNKLSEISNVDGPDRERALDLMDHLRAKR